MGLIALDLGVRGAASGLFLLILLVLLKLRPFNAKIGLGAAMAASGAAYAISTAPFVPKSLLMMALPVLAANPVIVWLWARATFDDDFLLEPWHGAVWLAMVGAGTLIFLGWPLWPSLAPIGAKGLSLADIVFAMLAAAQTVRTWREDLVAGRRRLRIVVLGFNVLLIAVVAGSAFTSRPVVNPDAPGNLGSALVLFAIAMLVGWSLFGTTAPAIPATAAAAPDGVAPRSAMGDSDARQGIAPALLRRLDHLMSTERIYRQEGLTIGLLAARLNLPEYRLRQAINEGLGYRNFNAFLNRYRIGDAKAGLSDPSQRDVPVLTIAMDAGFQSIGPFNRAFRADTGMTPTEFRRDALARPQTGDAERGGDRGIRHSG